MILELPIIKALSLIKGIAFVAALSILKASPFIKALPPFQRHGSRGSPGQESGLRRSLRPGSGLGFCPQT